MIISRYDVKQRFLNIMIKLANKNDWALVEYDVSGCEYDVLNGDFVFRMTGVFGKNHDEGMFDVCTSNHRMQFSSESIYNPKNDDDMITRLEAMINSAYQFYVTGKDMNEAILAAKEMCSNYKGDCNIFTLVKQIEKIDTMFKTYQSGHNKGFDDIRSILSELEV